MKLEQNLLIFLCFIVFVVYIVHKPQTMESFLNPCQYYQMDLKYGERHNLKQQVGRVGIEVEKEYLHPSEYRTTFERKPEPRFKMECSGKKQCYWKPIYTSFYPDLRGEQKNMISP